MTATTFMRWPPSEIVKKIDLVKSLGPKFVHFSIPLQNKTYPE